MAPSTPCFIHKRYPWVPSNLALGVADFVLSTPKIGLCSSKVEKSPIMSQFVIVPLVGGTFSPLRISLRLDNHNYSPTVMQMIVEAAVRLHSFADAAYALRLAGVSISSRHIHRIALQIGCELIKQRDQNVLLRRRRKLPIAVAANPTVVAVEVDGGRLRTRASARGPGVHEKQNKENKIACLITLQSQPSEIDPQP